MKKVLIVLAFLVFAPMYNAVDALSAEPVVTRPVRPTRVILSPKVHYVGSMKKNENTTPEPKKTGTQWYDKKGMERMTKRRTVVTRMTNTFGNKLAQYEDFLKKVQSRRAKLAQEGKDVAKLDAFIQQAQARLAETKTALESGKSFFSRLDFNDDKKNLNNSVKGETKKIRQMFTDLHRSMKDAVKTIRDTTTGGDSLKKNDADGEKQGFGVNRPSDKDRSFEKDKEKKNDRRGNKEKDTTEE